MKNTFCTYCLLLSLVYLCSCLSRNTSATTQQESHVVPEVKSVFINGDSIHYIDMGKGNPVIFVHGSLGDYRTWLAQMDTFARSHRVIAYSRRYAYPNLQPINDSADYSVIPHAKDLAALITTLNLGQVHLVGHSYGAFTALLTTIDHPELVRSLTLGEPPVMSLLQQVPGGDTLMHNFITNALMPAAKAFKENNNEKAVSIFLGGVMGDSLFFSKIPLQGRTVIMANTLELRGSVFTKDLFPPVSCDDLRKIKIPVLLMQGDRSPLLFTSITKVLDHCLYNKENAILANASHGLEFENPSEFNRIVLGFIAKHNASK